MSGNMLFTENHLLPQRKEIENGTKFPFHSKHKIEWCKHFFDILAKRVASLCYHLAIISGDENVFMCIEMYECLDQPLFVCVNFVRLHTGDHKQQSISSKCHHFHDRINCRNIMECNEFPVHLHISLHQSFMLTNQHKHTHGKKYKYE